MNLGVGTGVAVRASVGVGVLTAGVEEGPGGAAEPQPLSRATSTAAITGNTPDRGVLKLPHSVASCWPLRRYNAGISTELRE